MSETPKPWTSETLDPSAFRDVLYSDPLRDQTTKAARNLAIISTLTLFTQVFGISTKSAPWVPLDFSSRPDALPMFLGVATVVMLINFLMKLLTDHLRRLEMWAEVIKFIHAERVIQAEIKARQLDREAFGPDDNDDHEPEVFSWWQDADLTEEEAHAVMKKLRNRIGERCLPQFLFKARFWLEGGVPMALGLLAATASAGHVWQFAKAVVIHFGA